MIGKIKFSLVCFFDKWFFVFRIIKSKLILVSFYDRKHLLNHKWHLLPVRGKRNKFYVTRTEGRKTIYLHRQIMGAEKGELIDHRNRNPLDCRRCNLRFATHAQNVWNRQTRINSTTGYKCVYIKKNKKHKNKYYAMIQCEREIFFLGYFDNPLDASLAYNQKAKELFGEFAYLN